MACSLPPLLGEGFCSERCHLEQHKWNSCLGEQGQGRHLPDCACRTRLGTCRDPRSKQSITRAWPTAWGAFNTAGRLRYCKQPGNAPSLTHSLGLARKRMQTKALLTLSSSFLCFRVLFTGHLLDKHFSFLPVLLTQLLGTSEPCPSQHHSWARPQHGIRHQWLLLLWDWTSRCSFPTGWQAAGVVGKVVLGRGRRQVGPGTHSLQRSHLTHAELKEWLCFTKPLG